MHTAAATGVIESHIGFEQLNVLVRQVVDDVGRRGIGIGVRPQTFRIDRPLIASGLP